MAFFRITATQYLTALALVQDYRRHVCFLRPPPTPMLYISNIPTPDCDYMPVFVGRAP